MVWHVSAYACQPASTSGRWPTTLDRGSAAAHTWRRCDEFGPVLSAKIRRSRWRPRAGRAELGGWIIPLERLLSEIPAAVLNERGLKRATHGNEIVSEDVTAWGAQGAADARLLDSGGTVGCHRGKAARRAFASRHCSGVKY